MAWISPERGQLRLLDHGCLTTSLVKGAGCTAGAALLAASRTFSRMLMAFARWMQKICVWARPAHAMFADRRTPVSSCPCFAASWGSMATKEPSPLYGWRQDGGVYTGFLLPAIEI